MLVDDAGVAHHVEHRRAPRERTRGVDRWRVGGGRFHEARDQRRLRDVQVGRVLAEVTERCGFDSVEAVAEVRLVQVQLEDLILAERAFEAAGEHELLQLPADGLVRRQEAEPRELLRDGAPALLGAVARQVVQQRARQADRIDAAVVVKAPVFDRDHRARQVR